MNPDSRGNLHDPRDGRFAGHLLHEADTAAILDEPLAGRLADWLAEHTDADPQTAGLLRDLAATFGVQPRGVAPCDRCGTDIPDTRQCCDPCQYRLAAIPVVPDTLRDQVDAGVVALTRAVCNDPRYLHINGDDELLAAATDEVTRRIVATPHDSIPAIVAGVLQAVHVGPCDCTDPSHAGGPGHPVGAETIIVDTRWGTLRCGDCNGHQHRRYGASPDRWGLPVQHSRGLWRAGA